MKGMPTRDSFAKVGSAKDTPILGDRQPLGGHARDGPKPSRPAHVGKRVAPMKAQRGCCGGGGGALLGVVHCDLRVIYMLVDIK